VINIVCIKTLFLVNGNKDERREPLAVVSPYNINKTYKWWENLVVELAVFVDQYLWEKFSKTYSHQNAYSQLQDFVATMMNNVILKN